MDLPRVLRLVEAVHRNQAPFGSVAGLALAIALVPVLLLGERRLGNHRGPKSEVDGALFEAEPRAFAHDQSFSPGPLSRSRDAEASVRGTVTVMTDATFDPLADADLASWLAQTQQTYVTERVASGDTLAEATANANANMERLFPGGRPAPGQLVGRVVCDGGPVGELWVGPAGNDPQRWWVWNIEVDEGHRGKGYGRKAMLLAEQLARTNGATTLGLNVFGHNHVARSLYTSLGYAESSVQMRKALN